MENNNISIKDSLEYFDEELIDISDLDLDNLRIDKKNGKILLFTTFIISIKIKSLLINCIYQLKMFLDMS